MNTEDFSNKTTLLKAKTRNINIKVPIATKFAWNTYNHITCKRLCKIDGELKPKKTKETYHRRDISINFE